MGIGAVLGNFGHPAANLHITIGVGGIHYREGDFAPLLQGPGLDPPGRGVDANPIAGAIEPDWRHLGGAIFHYGGNRGEGFGLVTQKVAKVVRYVFHKQQSSHCARRSHLPGPGKFDSVGSIS
jgi:hypothetical protein